MSVSLAVELIILLSIIIISLVILMVWLRGLSRTSVPFIPVADHVLDPIIDALRLSPNAVLYDLGSGDARVLTHIANKHPTINAIGIERTILPSMLGRFRRLVSPTRKSITLKNADFFEENLSDATHIFVFLFPKIMPALELKLDRELALGTRVVSCDFQFPNKKPDEEIILSGAHAHGKRLLVYTF
jgi:hypothetical protein